jgi:hypothetical protein
MHLNLDRTFSQPLWVGWISELQSAPTVGTEAGVSLND